jgi:hypothetical protein
MPLTLTQDAIAKLQRELILRRTRSAEAFRLLATASGGFGMRLDRVRSADVVLHHEGQALLLVGPALADNLSDAVLDVGQGPDEPDWVLVRGKPS